MGQVLASTKEKAAKTAKVTAKLSMSIGDMIDTLHANRERKRALEAQIKEVEGEYAGIEEQLLAALDTQKIDASRGSKASCSITKTTKANIKDFDAFTAWVKKTGHFHLFQRRVTDTAYREILESGKQVPGLEPFTKRTLNLRSL